MATIQEECARISEIYRYKKKHLKSQMAMGYAHLLLCLKIESSNDEENVAKSLGKAMVSQELAVAYYGLDRKTVERLYYSELGIKPTGDIECDRKLLSERAQTIYNTTLNYQVSGVVQLVTACENILMQCFDLVAPNRETEPKPEELEKAFADARIAMMIVFTILWQLDINDVFKAEVEALIEYETYLKMAEAWGLEP